MKNVPGGNKIVATFCATLFVSIILLIVIFFEGETLGPEIIGSFIIFFLYAGFIILVFGSYVSYCLEFLLKKWGDYTNLSLLMYILLHGLFGSLIGIIYKAVDLAIIGFFAAIVYGIVDVRIGFKYIKEQ
ncbi:hypothetical protein IHV09_09980 [Fictibacillus sp. 23RED33]|uniref:hypothetical protein n=1 Tax=Fictibacillus sp. 23RED33 TaxID=2745879 RepID=UPI0018CD3A77|nr:hypothetical protein [Fictibacillus sp. 23RED33]MBH0173889.1 hypothetical protein [Fictibacillus sp. 23RED33]